MCFPQEYRIKSASLSSPPQLRSIPVKGAEDDELEEEADWIYRNAFATPTISLQVSKKKILRFDMNWGPLYQGEDLLQTSVCLVQDSMSVCVRMRDFSRFHLIRLFFDIKQFHTW